VRSQWVFCSAISKGSIQGLLNSVVTSLNARTASTDDDVGINPYLIPRAGVSSGSPWIEVDLPNGQTIRESVGGDHFTERLINILVANGGLAPAWQINTLQMQWQEDMEIKAQLQAVPKVNGNHYEINSMLRNRYDGHMPFSTSKSTQKQASNDAQWQQAA
jgi:hypothetical protein